MKKVQVPQAAYDRIHGMLIKELGASQRKLEANRSHVKSLAKEQREIKASIGALFVMIRELEGKAPRVSKKKNVKA